MEVLNTRRPTYNRIEGEKVSRDELDEDDEVALRVSWFGDFDEALARPTHFTVKRNDIDVVLEGRDGNTYRLREGSPHVLCNTDGGKGSHRGNLSARVKVID